MPMIVSWKVPSLRKVKHLQLDDPRCNITIVYAGHVVRVLRQLDAHNAVGTSRKGSALQGNHGHVQQLMLKFMV